MSSGYDYYYYHYYYYFPAPNNINCKARVSIWSSEISGTQSSALFSVWGNGPDVAAMFVFLMVTDCLSCSCPISARSLTHKDPLLISCLTTCFALSTSTLHHVTRLNILLQTSGSKANLRALNKPRSLVSYSIACLVVEEIVRGTGNRKIAWHRDHLGS